MSRIDTALKVAGGSLGVTFWVLYLLIAILFKLSLVAIVLYGGYWVLAEVLLTVTTGVLS